MKLSELIDKATKAMGLVGDVDVVILTDTPDGLFCSDFNPWVDLIQIPVDEYSKKEETVFAVAWGEIEGGDGKAQSEQKLKLAD